MYIKFSATLANVKNDPCIYILYTSQSWTTSLQFNNTVLVVFYVCGALTLGNSYTSDPCTNTDGAQQFSTGFGYESGAGISDSGWVSSSFISSSLMRSFSCSMRSSSADIFWASDSQLSVHWLLMRHKEEDTIIVRVEYLLENIIVMTNALV